MKEPPHFLHRIAAQSGQLTQTSIGAHFFGQFKDSSQVGYLLNCKFLGASPLRYFTAQDALISCYDEFRCFFSPCTIDRFFASALLALLAFSSATRQRAAISA